MYYLFQQRDEISSVLFYESCETQEDLDNLVKVAAFPIMFTYDDVSRQIVIVDDYYDLQQCYRIINSLLN